MVVLHMIDAPPGAGWLYCDGASYSTALYPNLFAAIGYAFGGSGASFNVPDYRERFPVGKGGSGLANIWAQTGGSWNHTHTGAAHTHSLDNHTHSLPSHYHSVDSNGATININTSSGDHTTSITHDHGGALTDNNVNTGKHTHTAVSASTGITLSDTTVIPYNNPTPSYGIENQTLVSGEHRHTILGKESGAGGTARYVLPESGGVAYTNIPGNPEAAIGLSGLHAHQVWTLPHNHTVNDPNHSHTIPTSGTHGHIYVVPTKTGNSSSSGKHGHNNGSFDGFVGNVNSANNGDSSLTSGGPSSNITGSADYGANKTGSANPPFLVTHFIIKT